LTKKQKNIQKESAKKESLDELEDFSFEVSSTFGDMEIVEEIPNEEDDELSESLEDLPPKNTIKIISEKDMEIKEVPPPNYSPNFICVLHFRNQDYKKRKRIPTESTDE
jgi:hypothetical protein